MVTTHVDKVPAAVLSALHAQPVLPASRVIKIANNQQVDVVLSAQNPNRIAVKDDKITGIHVPAGRISATKDNAGAIYVTLAGKKAFSLFISTEKGRHFALWVTPQQSRQGAVIQLRPTSRVSHHYQRYSSHAANFEKHAPYTRTLVSLIKTAMQHKVPPGYSNIATNSEAFKQIAAFKLANNPRYQQVLSQRVIKGYIGGALAVRVIEVDNTSHQAITLSSDMFYQPGVKAIAIARNYLAPISSTYVYEVVNNA